MVTHDPLTFGEGIVLIINHSELCNITLLNPVAKNYNRKFL